MEKIRAMDITPGMGVDALIRNYQNAGLQASQLGKAVQVVRAARKKKARIILTMTTNLVSSGMRELFARLCRERRVDAIITAIGSVEEDLMKSMGDFELASFEEDDVGLHKAGRNRVGNIIIPNKSYEKLEKVLMPFFEAEYQKQMARGKPLAPHELIADLGAGMKDEGSFVYWAARNKIPVFCPAPTDGAFGLQMYFFKQKRPEFMVDASGDLKPLGQLVLDADSTAGIILGGGVAKHHAIGVNILRGGFDYAVYVSTATEYDGSLSGARASEAKSWGKIKEGAMAANVFCDASIAFPLIAVALLE